MFSMEISTSPIVIFELLKKKKVIVIVCDILLEPPLIYYVIYIYQLGKNNVLVG